MTPTKLPRHRAPFTYPRRPVEPVRPVTGCDTCDLGCDCEGGVEGVGCAHWSCWGRTATNDCPIGTDALRAHMHARTEYRNALYAFQQSSHLR
ncbi:MAG: hypothetical protein ACXVGF_04665 [Blastococcus sp.]